MTLRPVYRSTAASLLALVLSVGIAGTARADHLLNLKQGEPVPTYRLPAIDDSYVESASMKGSVVVMVCLSAEQRSSEMASLESRDVVAKFAADGAAGGGSGGGGGGGVRLVHVTADAISKPYFQKFRQERGVNVPLAIDADRTLYRQLGLIVFPTTIVIGKDGKLAHVLSLCTPEYGRTLDAYVKHALGTLSDEQLAAVLKAQPTSEGSPQSFVSAHRATARLMREKGRLDGAIDELTKAREQDPKNSEVLLDLAEIDLLKNNLDAAEALVKEVLAAQPDHRRAKQVQGIALFRRDKLDESEKVLREALTLNPDPARVHYFLGRIAEKRGNAALAAEHYREALKKLIPDVEPAPNADRPATGG